MRMKRPRRSVALLLLAACGAFAPAAVAAPGKSAGNSPAAVVRGLYQAHDRLSRTGEGLFSKKTGKQGPAKYFDAKLTALLWKNILGPPGGGLSNLDFDLVKILSAPF